MIGVMLLIALGSYSMIQLLARDRRKRTEMNADAKESAKKKKKAVILIKRDYAASFSNYHQRKRGQTNS